MHVNKLASQCFYNDNLHLIVIISLVAYSYSTREDSSSALGLVGCSAIYLFTLHSFLTVLSIASMNYYPL